MASIRSFKETFADAGDVDAYRQAYRDWSDNVSPQQVVVPEYTQTWGGGCCDTPITKEDFHAYIMSNGFPDREHVEDPSLQQTVVACDHEVDFEKARDTDIWGRGRIDRQVHG